MKYLRTPYPSVAELSVATVLVLVPFQAFLAVWGSSLVGHYTSLRLIDDTLAFILMILAVTWLARDAAMRQWFFSSLLVRLIFSYIGLVVLLGFVSYIRGDVTPKALAYGILLDCRFLGWFMAVLLTAQRSTWLQMHWKQLLLLPAAVVVLFAVLQYTVLPHQFLSHFGYNSSTIVPIETINHNDTYIRVQSTLRGANPLGAYLVVILSALGVLFVRGRRRLLAAAFGLIGLLALYASGSRSAWIGAVLAGCVVAWFALPHGRARQWFAASCAAGLIVVSLGYLVLRNNVSFQNAVLHTQNHSAVSVSSNAAHASALSEGVHEAIHQPLGDGAGTAGPASEYNGTRSPRIAEDYYVQVAQETGWLGLAVFLAIGYLVGTELYAKARKSPLALVVLAAYVGILFVNLLSHAWADNTLAYIWWGFAAIALAKVPKRKSQKAAA